MQMTKSDLKAMMLAEIKAGGQWPPFRPKSFAKAHNISYTTVYKYLSELSVEGKIFKYRYGSHINYTCIELVELKSWLIK